MSDPMIDAIEALYRARADAHIYGNGYVRMTRQEDGTVEVERIDPASVTIRVEEASVEEEPG